MSELYKGFEIIPEVSIIETLVGTYREGGHRIRRPGEGGFIVTGDIEDAKRVIDGILKGES